MAERFMHPGIRAKDQGRAEGYAKRAGYKAGGAVRHDDEAQDKKLIAKMIGEEEKREAKRPKRKRGGFVPGQAVVGRLDKKPRNGKSAEQVYATPGRTDVQKPKITNAPAERPKRATGGPVPKSVAGPQNHNGMGKLANLGKFAHGGKIKRDGGGMVPGAVPGMTPPVMATPGTLPMRASGGRVKKPSVNVIINTGGAPKPPGDDPAKAILPALLAAKAGAGGPPPGMPPGPPPGMPPMGGPPPGLPGGAPPPMMRKSGGRIPAAKDGPETIKVREHERRKAGGKVC